MSSDKERLSQAQLKEINELIERSNAAATRALQQSVIAALQDNEKKLLASLETNVGEAIKNNQRVLIATVESGASGEAGVKKKEPKTWQVLALVTPIILTALFGLYVDRRVESLKSRLNLTSKFYEKKLSVYESNHKTIVLLVEALHNAQVDPASAGKAIESLHDLNQGYTVDSLYMSNDLLKSLKELYKAGVEMPAVRRTGQGSISNLMTKVSAVEEQMKKDLRLDEVGQINVIFEGAR